MKYKSLLLVFLLITSQVSNAQTNIKDILKEKIPVSYIGKPIDAYEYNDNTGKNIFLITKIEDNSGMKIKGAKYTLVSDKYQKKWEINDFGGEVLFHFSYTRIIDIDKDGTAETIFAYEIDQVNWKVILHNNDKKYALRIMVPQLDGDKYTCEFDPSFKNISPGFKKYVNEYWNEIVRKEGLKTD